MIRTIGTVAIAVSLVTGCGAFNTLNNARSGYQAYTAYNMAKGISEAAPIFQGVESYTISVDLMPRDENQTENLQTAFRDAAAEKTEIVLNDLSITASYCASDCPNSPLVIQFREQGRDGFAEKVAMGNYVKGEMYVLQEGRIIEQHTFDVADDYQKMARLFTNAIAVRAGKSAQVNLQNAYEEGQISNDEYKNQLYDQIDRLNALLEEETEHFQVLEGKS